MNFYHIIEVSLLISLLAIFPWFGLMTALKLSIDYLDQLSNSVKQ